jgi:membrane fusion protein (multidrug efflux system)
MSNSPFTIRLRAGAILLLIGLCSPAGAQPADTAAVPVGTTNAERRSIARSLDFVGRIEAISRVDVRARVSGYLDAVLFKDGDVVKDGAVLYRIERGLFEAAVKQAEGALASSKAALGLAVLQFERGRRSCSTGTPEPSSPGIRPRPRRSRRAPRSRSARPTC